MAHLTDTELKAIKDSLDQHRDAFVSSARYNIPRLVAEVERLRKIEKNFTCGNCDKRYECPFSFDLYNTNGDCLANK